jgi:hypothetical protein
LEAIDLRSIRVRVVTICGELLNECIREKTVVEVEVSIVEEVSI